MSESRPFRHAMRNLTLITAGGLTFSGDPAAGLTTLVFGFFLTLFVNR